MSFRFSKVGVTLACVMAVGVAHAYAPSPGYIMNLVAVKRVKQKLEAIRVTVKRVDVVENVPQEPVEETLTFRSGGRVRREWTDKTGKHAYVADATRAVVVDGDKRTKTTPEPNMLDALWSTGGEGDEREGAMTRGVGVLTAWGVAENVAFSRMDGRVAWVVGGTAPGTPQVWVDKDDFLPLRFIVGTGPRKEGEPVNGPWLDTRLRSWGSAAGGEFFPGRIETYKDGVLIRTQELVKVDVTPKLDERDFKLD